MKSLILVTVLFCCTVATQAQPPKGDAKPGDFYGEKPTTAAVAQAVSISQLQQTMQNKDSANVAIKGVVTDVCDKKGCWIKLQTASNEKVFVKMKDYGFFVPTSLKGKTVIMDGQAKFKNVSVAEQKHYAEDAKKSKAEIDAIKEPKTEIRYLASGIAVVK